MATTSSRAAPEASAARPTARRGNAARMRLARRAGGTVGILLQRTVAVGRGALRGLLAAALPPTCVVCGRWPPDGRDLACAACHAVLDGRRRLPYCRRCGRTLPAAAIHTDGCARCRTEAFWNVAAVARAGPYVGGLRDLLLDLKYRGQERNAEYAGDLLADELRGCDWPGTLDALVPVPMHWLRRLLRGVNGPELVAERLAQRLGLDYEARVVRRPRYSRPQGSLPPGERRKNVRRALALGKGYDVRGMRVLLVDDIMTTGTTVNTAARLLKRAGAATVAVVVLARAQGG